MITISMDSQILTSLMSCARFTDFRFNLNLAQVGGKSNSLECGSLVHTILEFYGKALIRGASRSDAIVEGFIAGDEYIKPYNELNRYVTEEDHQGMVNTTADGDKWNTGWNYVLDTMRQYFDFWSNDSFIILGVEETRGAIIYQDEDLTVLWKAKYDKIVDMPNGLMSVDYKTMKQNRDTLSLNNQFMGQCTLIGARNLMIDKIGFQSSLPAEKKFIRAIISYPEDALEEWKNDIVPHYARMLAAYTEVNNFPPNFTHCESKFGTCQYINICTAPRSLREDIMNTEFVKGKTWDI